MTARYGVLLQGFAKNEAAEKQNRVIMELVHKKELKAEDIENYKHEHPVVPADIWISKIACCV